MHEESGMTFCLFFDGSCVKRQNLIPFTNDWLQSSQSPRTPSSCCFLSFSLFINETLYIPTILHTRLRLAV